MKNHLITEGLAFKEVMTNKELQNKHWIFNFNQKKVNGVNIEGVCIYFPKINRTAISDLNHQALAGMKLKKMVKDNGQIAFFLIS